MVLLVDTNQYIGYNKNKTAGCSGRRIVFFYGPHRGVEQMGSSAVSVAADRWFESNLRNQKREVKPLTRELTQQNIMAIQKIINKGSVAEVKVEKGFIVVIEINRKKVN